MEIHKEINIFRVFPPNCHVAHNPCQGIEVTGNKYAWRGTASCVLRGESALLKLPRRQGGKQMHGPTNWQTSTLTVRRTD